MITSSNSLFRERDAHSNARRYFTPCPVPGCPTYEPNSNDGEYAQPFRHIQYKRIPSFRPIAIGVFLSRCERSIFFFCALPRESPDHRGTRELAKRVPSLPTLRGLRRVRQ